MTITRRNYVFKEVFYETKSNAYLEKQNERLAHEVELDPGMEDTGDDFCISITENAALSDAMKHIRERERTVITLRAVEGRSFQEIAVQLGMKYSSVTMV